MMEKKGRTEENSEKTHKTNQKKRKQKTKKTGPGERTTTSTSGSDYCANWASLILVDRR